MFTLNLIRFRSAFHMLFMMAKYNYDNLTIYNFHLNLVMTATIKPTFTVVQTQEQNSDGKYVPNIFTVPDGWIIVNGWAGHLANLDDPEDVPYGIGYHLVRFPSSRSNDSRLQKVADSDPNTRTWSILQCKILQTGFGLFDEVYEL